MDFLFGPFGSGAAKAVSAVTEKYGVPMLTPNAASEQVYDQGFKYLFGVYTPNRSLAEPTVQLVKDKHPEIRKVAILARNDLFPTAMADEIQTAVGDKVRVSMHLDRGQSAAADTAAVIVAPTLVSDRYVQLTKPYTSGKRLASGATITQTAVPVEIDKLYQSLDSIANARRAHAPAVFVLSGKDEVVPPAYARRVFDAYAGHKYEVRLPDAEHNVDLELPQELARAVLRP